jgi:hypothetical protein
MKPRRRWTDREDARLRRAYARARTTALAAELGRSVQAVLSRANVLGLHKAAHCIPRGRQPKHPWRADEDALLRRLYADTPTAQIAAQLGRTEASTYQRARTLRLAKSAAYLASALSGRIRPGDTDRGLAGRFKPGNRPWTTGRKGYQAGGQSPAFRFKPGQMPHNWRPIGSTRIAGGILQRKHTETGYPPRDWVSVHRSVWEATHGPVPAGHVVVFKNGRHTTDEAAITLDALELLTRAQVMARNTRHNLPPELNELIQLRGALNRKINNRTRAREEQDHRRA